MYCARRNKEEIRGREREGGCRGNTCLMKGGMRKGADMCPAVVVNWPHSSTSCVFLFLDPSGFFLCKFLMWLILVDRHWKERPLDSKISRSAKVFSMLWNANAEFMEEELHFGWEGIVWGHPWLGRFFFTLEKVLPLFFFQSTQVIASPTRILAHNLNKELKTSLLISQCMVSILAISWVMCQFLAEVALSVCWMITQANEAARHLCLSHKQADTSATRCAAEKQNNPSFEMKLPTTYQFTHGHMACFSEGKILVFWVPKKWWFLFRFWDGPDRIPKKTPPYKKPLEFVPATDSKIRPKNKKMNEWINEKWK